MATRLEEGKEASKEGRTRKEEERQEDRQAGILLPTEAALVWRRGEGGGETNRQAGTYCESHSIPFHSRIETNDSFMNGQDPQ